MKKKNKTKNKKKQKQKQKKKKKRKPHQNWSYTLRVMFVFVFVKNVNFDQLWKSHKFQKFSNFRIKIKPIVDSFSLILKKTLHQIIKYQIYIIFTYIRTYLFKIRNFSKNSGNCRWLYCIPLTTQFRPEVDLGPFGNELFICWQRFWLKTSLNRSRNNIALRRLQHFNWL